MNQMFGGYTPEDALEIHRRVLGKQFSQKPVDNTRDLTIHNQMYYVTLTEALSAAGNELTGYTQAQATIIRYVQPMVNNLNMAASTAPDGVITITNRFSGFSAGAGETLLVIRNGSEWSPVTSVAATIKHVKIRTNLGKGYYVAEFMDPISFALPSSTGTGTDATAAQIIEGESTGTAAIVCGSVVNPSRVTLSASIQSCYTYDPRLLPLDISGHAIVIFLGDRVDISTYYTGTSTGTHMDDLWIVLTATRSLVGIPDKHYTCCSGVWTLTQCDMYIVEGLFLSGNSISC
jgi:hypothetical protein